MLQLVVVYFKENHKKLMKFFQEKKYQLAH